MTLSEEQKYQIKSYVESTMSNTSMKCFNVTYFSEENISQVGDKTFLQVSAPFKILYIHNAFQPKAVSSINYINKIKAMKMLILSLHRGIKQ